MAVVSIVTLKSYFEAGDKPTEAQYIDLIDTLSSLPAAGGSISWDSLTSGTVSAESSRFGGSATVIANPGTGIYSFTVQASTELLTLDVDGVPGSTDAGNFTIQVDNSVNSRDRFFEVQIINKATGDYVDVIATGTAPTQTAAANVTSIVFGNMNGFSASGFKILLR